MRIGDALVGQDQPVYVIAEIGINHNGDLDIARRLIDVAADAGCQAVKFQKRTPEICVPLEQRDQIRQTPWGEMTYMEYKIRTEFGADEYTEIAKYAAERDLHWFASPWDVPSVEFLEEMNVVTHKVASASVTDLELLRALAATDKPIILSTGMSTLEEIDRAVEILGTSKLVLMHATSTYPLPPEEANLRTIATLQERYGVPVGYSGHERGLQISLAAVTLGAVAVERHITLDRTMWGSDHAASLEPSGLEHLVRDIRIIETALGDGVKRVFPGEQAPSPACAASRSDRAGPARPHCSPPLPRAFSPDAPAIATVQASAPAPHPERENLIKLSVVVPVRDAELYISDALTSLAANAHRDFEFIVVDDGSVDQTGQVIEDFRDDLPGLVVLRNETPAGLADARNIGLSLASGRYVTFMDGDDWLAPDTSPTWSARSSGSAATSSGWTTCRRRAASG
nr:hypothetical protein GCM10020093_004480 [Planobispora longispora]